MLVRQMSVQYPPIRDVHFQQSLDETTKVCIVSSKEESWDRPQQDCFASGPCHPGLHDPFGLDERSSNKAVSCSASYSSVLQGPPRDVRPRLETSLEKILSLPEL